MVVSEAGLEVSSIDYQEFCERWLSSLFPMQGLDGTEVFIQCWVYFETKGGRQLYGGNNVVRPLNDAGG